MIELILHQLRPLRLYDMRREDEAVIQPLEISDEAVEADLGEDVFEILGVLWKVQVVPSFHSKIGAFTIE